MRQMRKVIGIEIDRPDIPGRPFVVNILREVPTGKGSRRVVPERERVNAGEFLTKELAEVEQERLMVNHGCPGWSTNAASSTDDELAAETDWPHPLSQEEAEFTEVRPG